MGNQSSGKLLHLPPQQFDLLLQDLEAQTPPKTQLLFSMRQVVERLYDFIERSLAHHYAFDELAVIIHKSLLKLDEVGEVPEIKGETLKKYFLDAKRERESGAVKKGRLGASRMRAGTKKGREERVVEPPIAEAVETRLRMEEKMELETRSGTAKRLPTNKSSPVELAY